MYTHSGVIRERYGSGGGAQRARPGGGRDTNNEMEPPLHRPAPLPRRGNDTERPYQRCCCLHCDAAKTTRSGRAAAIGAAATASVRRRHDDEPRGLLRPVDGKVASRRAAAEAPAAAAAAQT